MGVLGFGNFITPKGLVNLKNYKYKSGVYTPLDNFMQPFWNWFVTLIPMWMAPNLVTFAGLLFSLSSCIMYLPFDGSGTMEFPAYTYLIGVFGMFMYQTLDAVDGKQARRTGSSSPLGQLFDHGCDAINTSLFLCFYIQSMQIGSSPNFFILTILSIITFYASQWEEHESHILRTSIGFFGVTESKSSLAQQHAAQNTMMLLILINTFTGQTFCKMKVGETPLIKDFAPEITQDCLLLSCSLLLAIFTSIIQFITAVYNALSYTSYRPRILVLKGLLPLVLCANMVYLTFAYTDWAWSHANYCTILFCPVLSMINSRQIVCNVTDMDMNCFPKLTLWFLLFPVNRLLPKYVSGLTTYAKGFDNTPLMFSEEYVALVVFCIISFWYLHFAIGTVKQICNYLEINCFQIKVKPA